MFHWIRLRAFVYATEDREKVIQAMNNLVEGEPKISHAEGAYGDPIEILEISGKRDRIAKDIISKMPDAERKALLETLESRTDDDSIFHFRIDKQEAYLGNIRLGSGGDVIGVEMKMESYPSSRERAVENMGRFLEGMS